MEAVLKYRLEQTYKAERKNLLSYIKAKVGDIEDAEDLLQDVFYSSLLNLNALESMENLIGWLYTVAKNKIIDRYRKRKNQNISIEDELSVKELIDESGIKTDDGCTRSLILDAIWNAIEELPVEQRNVIILQAIEGVSFREIASIEDVSINTLIARKRYAVKFLRKRLVEIKNLMS